MHEIPNPPNHLLEPQAHCHNDRCDEPHCQNPSCYNYSGTRQERHRHGEHHRHDYHDHDDHHKQGDSNGRHPYPNPHYPEVLQSILQRHHQHQDSFSNAQTDVSRHQQSLQVQQLQWVDHIFKGLVRSVLEHSQHELYERGFSSGIHSEIESVVDAQSNHHHHSHSDHNHTDNEGESHDYLIAMALHLNDIPNNEPSKNITSNNQIRFYRVADSIDIQCQFSNTKMQSKVFDLSFHHGEQQGGAQNVVEDVVQDFIGFILLSRRAGLNHIS